MPFSDTRGFVLSAAACAVVLALSGCGGGGGSASTTPPPGRSMAQLDPEPVALPEGVTLATAGTFTIEPGESVDRDGARFTCAAGGPACAVVVAERAGGGYAATATGGEVMVAAAQLPAPPDSGGGQPSGMEEADGPALPDWPVADAAAARALIGGSTLSWSSSDIRDRIAIAPYAGFGRSIEGIGVSVFACVDQSSPADDCEGITKYQSVMMYRGIPIVQGRFFGPLDVLPRYARAELGIFGILDRGHFVVRSGIDGLGDHLGVVDPVTDLVETTHAHFTSPDDTTRELLTGHWQGALVGTGNSVTSPLYRQFIIGDVDITVELGRQFRTDPGRRYRNVGLEFSNVRNINTGATVTLSRTRWESEETSSVDNYVDFEYAASGGYLTRMGFFGPNSEEALGYFRTEEAIGAFGAKKQ